jgi:hypothetical protein
LVISLHAEEFSQIRRGMGPGNMTQSRAHGSTPGNRP